MASGWLVVLSGCESATPPPTPFERFVAQDAVADAAEDPDRESPGGEAADTERPRLNKFSFAAGSISAANRQDGVRLGLEYERLWNSEWGLFDERVAFGLMFDFDTPPVEIYLLAFQMIYRPLPPVKIVVAPGLRFRPSGHDEWMIRAGMSYEFDLGKQWSLGPEFFVDQIEFEEVEGIVAIALTREF